MVRSFVTLSFLAALVSAVSCAGDPPVPQGPRLSVVLTPGPAYQTVTWWGVLPLPIYPQAALWVETPDGRFVTTVYATAKGARNNWISAPPGGRPEALPVWTHRRTSEVVDAVARATPAGTTRVELPVGNLVPGPYVALLEVNRSYDFNETYPSSAGVGGQPSVVYQAPFVLGSRSGQVDFVPLGTGSADGTSGSLSPGTSGLTSALSLFSSLSLEFLAD